MKAWVCDACRTVIENPHEVHMKEFYVDFGYELPRSTKRKVKIHLCDKCFHALREIAAKREAHE